MMGNFWLLNHARRWAAVCISKCACSTLKAHLVGDALDPRAAVAMSHNELHDWIGYAPSAHLIPISEPPPFGYLRFAVWRPPVERFLSTYRQFGLEGMPRQYLAPLRGATPDRWIEFARREMGKPVLRQDEHLRRQRDYYGLEQIDQLVHIAALSPWLEASFGYTPLVRNRTSAGARRHASEPEVAIVEAIMELYAGDDERYAEAARREIVIDPRPPPLPP